jgi:hypothetical protein
LAIEVHSPEVVERLKKIAHHDWKHSHPLDLTDEGLMAELEQHKIDAANELALNTKGKKKAKDKKTKKAQKSKGKNKKR